MSNINFCLKQINYKLKDSPLFYITNDPERALGLEKLLENYYIVCLDDSDIFANLYLGYKNIFSFENASNELNTLFRSSAKLLDEPIVKAYIEKIAPRNKFFQTFKITSAFEKRAEEFRAKMLNTSSELNKNFENKITQYELLSASEVKFPKTIIGALSEFNYKKLKKELGPKFVVQFNRGHTGSGTIIINNKDQYVKQVKRFPERTVRIVEFVEGIPYTLNACVVRNGIFIGGLNYQITGVEKLAPSKSATVGNDFSIRKGINKKVLQEIITETEKIGNAMKKSGFKGMFGIDLIVNDDGVKIIEINARQPASIPFYTKLQLKNNEIPLSALHIMEFLEQVNNLDAKEYSRRNLEPVNAGQLFLRNINDYPIIIKNRIKTGVYNKNKLLEGNQAFSSTYKEGWSIDDIKKSNDEFILLTQLKGKRINPGRELARIQTNMKLVDEAGFPFDWAINTLLSAEKIYLNN